MAENSPHSAKNKCWLNATKNIMFIADLSEGFYVEGFVVTPDGRIVEHGWNELDGRIIDTTPGYYEEYTGNIYFAAIRYGKADTMKLTYQRLPISDADKNIEYLGTLFLAQQYRNYLAGGLFMLDGRLQITTQWDNQNKYMLPSQNIKR